MAVIEKALLVPPPSLLTEIEAAGFTKMLLSNGTIDAGKELRLWPALDVSKWDRIHITVGGDAVAVPSLDVRVLFSVPAPGTHCGGILSSSTVWFEESATLREFEFATPVGFGHTGFTMSVPVIAPVLYDVILRNTGTAQLKSVYVALFAQEI